MSDNKRWTKRFGPNEFLKEEINENQIWEFETNVPFNQSDKFTLKGSHKTDESNRNYWYEFTSVYPIKQKIKYRNINKWFNKK